MNRRKFITTTSVATTLLSAPILVSSLDNRQEKTLKNLSQYFKKSSKDSLSSSLLEKFEISEGIELSKTISVFSLKNNKSFLLVDQKNNIAKEISGKQIDAYCKFISEFTANIKENDAFGVIDVSQQIEPSNILEIKNGIRQTLVFESQNGKTVKVTSKLGKTPSVFIS